MIDWTLPAFFVAGLLWWTLLEYLLHRWVFHAFPKSLGRRHLQHHARLGERRLAVAPLTSSVGGAAIHALVFFAAFGPEAGGALLAGLIAGYLAYEQVHWASHYRRPRTRLGKALRRHHMLHHHADPDAYFGVTSAFWDRVFGTLPARPRRGAAAASRGGQHHLAG